MIEALKDNALMILTLGFTFLVGIGVGAAVTDAIYHLKPPQMRWPKSKDQCKRH